MMDDLALERERRLVARGSPPVDPPGGAAAFTGKVTTASPQVGNYLLVNPVVVTGAETEGGAGTFTVDTATSIPVHLVGPGTPVTGDYLVCHQAGYRWVAEKTGGQQTVNLSGCSCAAVPVDLWMYPSDPTKNSAIFQNSRLIYGPTPSWATGLSVGSNGHFSPDWHTDNINSDQFIYFFTCYIGNYILTRLYQTSVNGSPYRDIVRYTWTIGLHGCTCTPFYLPSGQMFSGGDTSETVKIQDHA